MHALHIDADDAEPLEDEWEVAGAGAGPQIAGKKQLKSGAFISSSQDVLVQYDYPHKHVLRGAGRTPPLALDLTWSEFTSGYSDMMANPAMDPTERLHMLTLLKILMDDASIRPWPQVRHLHMTIIQAMEAGQLSWGDTEGMLAIQRQHSRTPVIAAAQPVRRSATPTHTANNVVTPLFCGPFQANACERQTDHESPRGFVRHICAFCLRLTGRPISSHGEADCRRKKQGEEPKNT
jgi:hypothetical protein